MEAKELRIGNLVYRKGDISNIYVADYITISCSENYLPILLTEEWLVRFGYTRFGSDDPTDIYYVHNKLPGYIDYKFNHRIPGHFKIKLRGVHHLQNIYSDFNDGEELTYE